MLSGVAARGVHQLAQCDHPDEQDDGEQRADQQAERQQTGRRGHMRGDDAGPVADAVHILAGQPSTTSCVTKFTEINVDSRAMSMPSVVENVTNSSGMKLLMIACVT